MLEIGTITLYREKSVIHKMENGLSDDGTDEERQAPVLSLRSNRVTIPIKTKLATIPVVVRGHNIPGTMRMAAVVVDEIRRDPQALQDPTDVDWETFWRRRISKYENDYMREAWVSVHVGGTLAFASTEDDNVKALAEIESLAAGADVTDALVQEAAANVLGALEDLVVEHDSQTAFVFTSTPQYLRAAILERRDRKTGSYAIAVYHPSPQRPVRLAAVISFASDLAETLTHKSFIDRIQDMIAANQMQDSQITPAQIQATRNRRKDLIQQIEDFEQANKVVYRPERPNLI
ncbi:MAG: hypothetical protein K1X51_12665 [Rhodospirillaceae bacterium]|nr:hypothetical protein [Rhodospirillaceae bacterium]